MATVAILRWVPGWIFGLSFLVGRHHAVRADEKGKVMNSDQVSGILRAVVPAALSYAVAKGWITTSMVGEITAALVTLSMAAWSIHNNQTGKTIA